MKSYLSALLSAILILHTAPGALSANDAQEKLEAVNRVQQAQQNAEILKNLQDIRRTQQALETVETLKRMNQQMGQEAYQKGMAAFENGDLAEAEKQLRKAIEYDSKAEYHFELANIYALYFDKFQDTKTNAATDTMLSSARRELELAVMQNPSMIPARYNLGVVYKRQGQFEKSREEFRKILELDPQQISAKVQIGAVYEAQGFFDEAETTYREAVDMAPYNLETKALIQDLKQHRELDRRQKAASEYSRGPMGRGIRNSDFTFSQNSHAAALAGQPGNPAPSGTGGLLSTAAPLAGSWLLQEFMKRRASRQNQNQ